MSVCLFVCRLNYTENRISQFREKCSLLSLLLLLYRERPHATVTARAV